MRTTLDISADLIREVMELTGAKTKSQAVKEALEAQIRKVKRQRLLSYKGKVDLNVDLDSTRNRT